MILCVIMHKSTLGVRIPRLLDTFLDKCYGLKN